MFTFSKTAILASAALALSVTQCVAATKISQTKSIHVTAGKFISKAAKVSGYAEIIEKGGKRFLVISHLSSPKCRVLLVKVENIADDASVKSSPKLDLGAAKTSATVSFPLSKDLDVWLYRSVSLWDAKTGRSLGIAELRSDQETTK